MEQGEFEKSIQEKLRQRTLTPSTNAWNKLEATLDVTPEKRFSFKYSYWIAASILVLVAVGSMFYNTNTVEETNLEMVDTKKQVQEQQKADPLTKQDAKITNAVSAIEKKKQPVFKSVGKVSEKPEKGLQLIANVQDQSTSIIAVHSLEIKLSDEEQEAIEVVTLIKETTKSSEVTDVEIDLLLTQARQQLASEKTAIANSSKVNATALLQDVETELNKPFKERIFEMLKDGYEKGKILVAQRN